MNDAALTLAPFSVLTWLKQFPSWTLTARLMPAAPPPPGVAIKKAAALAEGKDPDKEVAIARMKVSCMHYHPPHLPDQLGYYEYNPPFRRRHCILGCATASSLID